MKSTTKPTSFWKQLLPDGSPANRTERNGTASLSFAGVKGDARVLHGGSGRSSGLSEFRKHRGLGNLSEPSGFRELRGLGQVNRLGGLGGLGGLMGFTGFTGVRRLAGAGLALGLLLVSSTAWANAMNQPPPTPNTNPLSNPQALFGDRQSAAVSLGGGLLDGDLYLQSGTTLDFVFGKVGLGLQVPLNILLVPIASESRSDAAHWGVIRKADWPAPSWDNYSSYLRLIRYVRYGQKRDPLYVHYGQMYGSTLGHGTILDRYNNSLDPYRPRSGFALDVNTKSWGFETFINDIAWPSTNILGTRAWVRPIALAGKSIPVADKWGIGVSVVSDIKAASKYENDSTKEHLPSAGKGYEVRDKVMYPTNPRNRTILGLDTEIEVLRTSFLSLIPYMDYNWQLGAGMGLHMGAMANFRLPVFSALDLWTKLEYRLMQPGYIPNYFDALYDMQRFAFPVGAEVLVPKADAHRTLAPGGNGGFGDLTHGVLGEASLQILKTLEAGATYWDTPGVSHAKNLVLFLTLPRFKAVKFSAYYVRKNFDDADDFLAFDERSVLTAAAMVKIFGPLHALASYTRSWRLEGEDLVGSDDFNVGLQAYFPF